jgi:hypothetical protein
MTMGVVGAVVLSGVVGVASAAASRWMCERKRRASFALMPAGWEDVVPSFVDAATVTTEQAFALMLAKRIEDLESVSDRLKKAVGLDRPPPAPRIPDIPIPGLRELTQRVEKLLSGMRQDALVAERVSVGESVPELRDVLTRSQENELRSMKVISMSAANYFNSSCTTKDKIEHLEAVLVFAKPDYVKSAEMIAWIDRQVDRVDGPR